MGCIWGLYRDRLKDPPPHAELHMSYSVNTSKATYRGQCRGVIGLTKGDARSLDPKP